MRDAFAVCLRPAGIVDPFYLLVPLLELATWPSSAPACRLLGSSPLRYPLRAALSLAIAVGQTGNSSFILVQDATGTSRSAGTPSSPPLWCRLASTHSLFRPRRLRRSALGWPRFSAWFGRPFAVPAKDADSAEASDSRAVVVGYGPAAGRWFACSREPHPANCDRAELDTVPAADEGIRAVRRLHPPRDFEEAGTGDAVAFILTSWR